MEFTALVFSFCAPKSRESGHTLTYADQILLSLLMCIYHWNYRIWQKKALNFQGKIFECTANF